MANLWRKLFGGGTNPMPPGGPDEELGTEPEPSLEEPVSLYPGKVKWTYDIQDSEDAGDGVPASYGTGEKPDTGEGDDSLVVVADPASDELSADKAAPAGDLGEKEPPGEDAGDSFQFTKITLATLTGADNGEPAFDYGEKDLPGEDGGLGEMDKVAPRPDSAQGGSLGVHVEASQFKSAKLGGTDDDADPFDMDYKPVAGLEPSPMDDRELPAVQEVSDAADDELAHKLSDGEDDGLPAVQSEAPDEEPSTLLNLHTTPDLKELTGSDLDFDAEGADFEPDAPDLHNVDVSP